MGTKLNFSLLELDAIDSTNNYLSKLNNTSNVTNGTVILAYEQTQGKGQRGNSWQSSPYDNLTFSVLYKPALLAVSNQFILSMCVANALHACLNDYVGVVEIKWPNDILVNKKKIAGILIENSLQKNMISSSIIGIGLNVNQHHFNEINHATSLVKETNENHLLKEVLWKVLNQLKLQLTLLEAQQYDVIKSYYLKHLFGKNDLFLFKEQQKKNLLEGKIIDVKPNGELIVLQGENTKGYFFKEIEFILS